MAARYRAAGRGDASMIRKPSPGTILGVIALVVAMAGTAFAATGQLVNIADGSNAARLAHVNSSGQLQTQVNGSITSREAVPADLYRARTNTNGASCVPVATPPASSALVIKTVNVDVVSVGGSGSFVTFSIGAVCGSSFLSDVELTAKGLVTVPFDPGVAIPSGQRLWANVFSANIQVSAFGYKVPGGSLPG